MRNFLYKIDMRNTSFYNLQFIDISLLTQNVV